MRQAKYGDEVRELRTMQPGSLFAWIMMSQCAKWERREERLADMALAIETMWRAYSEVNEWIRAADIKAGTVLAANGVVIVAAVALAVGVAVSPPSY